MTKSRKTRVLMLLQNSPYSEDGRVLREARALRDAGYDVMVVSPRARGESRRMTLDGVELYQFTQCDVGNGFVGYALEYAWAMTTALAWTLWISVTRGFHVIHAHNPPDLFVLIAVLFKPFGVRFVYDQHDLTPEMFAARFGEGHSAVRRVLLMFEWLSCRCADLVIATNESYRKLQIERCGVPRERTTVVRNGPEPFHFAQVPPHPALRDAQGAVIGYVGEMGRQDGVDCLVRALGHLQNTIGRDDWTAVLVGEGEVQHELEALAEQLGIRGKLIFTGRVSFEEVVPYLAGMDLCTAPDPSNGYNDRSTLIKIMEYMAQGKPTVAFDLTETRYSAGESGVYVQPNDEHAFAQALADLIDDPARRDRLGAAGLRRVRESLTWAHSASGLVSAYRELTSGGAQPAQSSTASSQPTTQQSETSSTQPAERHEHCHS